MTEQNVIEQRVTIVPHPKLDVTAVLATFPRPLEGQTTPDWLSSLLQKDAQAPLSSDDAVRSSIRDMLRWGGFKPTGRAKPASEYLIKALDEGLLKPINPAVDACNAVSLHSGLPISVVDLDKVEGPLRIDVASPGESYIFNRSGQSIELGGLVCLFDGQGPCANAVRDSQRTKTDANTCRTLSILWGAQALPGRASAAAQWYGEMLERLGAQLGACRLEPGA